MKKLGKRLTAVDLMMLEKFAKEEDYRKSAREKAKRKAKLDLVVRYILFQYPDGGNIDITFFCCLNGITNVTKEELRYIGRELKKQHEKYYV